MGASYTKRDFDEAIDRLAEESEDLAVSIRLIVSEPSQISSEKEMVYGEDITVNYSEVKIWLKAIINDFLTAEEKEDFGVGEEVIAAFYINPSEFRPYNVYPLLIDTVTVDDLIWWDNKYFHVVQVSKNKIFKGGQPVLIALTKEKKFENV